jgi:hypothetical protein
METLIDPRTFEHPCLSITQLCFYFQLKRHQLTSHLKKINVEPARNGNGEIFTTRRASVFYAASEIVLALPPSARAIFLCWQRGDFVLPPIDVQIPATHLSSQRPP